MATAGPRAMRALIVSSVMGSVACSDHRTPTSPGALSLGIGTTQQSAPANLTAMATPSRGFDVAWTDNSTDETGFEIHASNVVDGSFSLYGQTGANITSATFIDGGYSVTRCFKARAFTAVGKRNRSYSTFSNTACATTAPPPPPAPSGTGARAVGSTVELTWRDNSSTEDGFRVERSPSQSCSAPWEAAGTTPANATSFTDVERVPEQWLCYRVVAFINDGSTSEPSPQARVVPIAAPSKLRALAADHRSIQLAWTANSALASGYDVHRAVTASGPYQIVARVYNSVEHVDRTVASNTTYWYRVRAVGTASISDFSNEIVVTTQPPPPPAPPVPPSGVDAWAYGSVLVIWTDNSWDEAGFTVELSVDDGQSWTPLGSTPPDSYGRWVAGEPVEHRNCYRVMAFNDLGLSPSLNVDCVTLIAGPSDATVTSGGAFAWKDRSNLEDGYEVWYCGPEECAPVSWLLAANSEAYSDPWYNPVFDYYVVSRKDDGYSEFAGVAMLGEPASSMTRKTVSLRDYLARSTRRPIVKRP